MEADRPGVSEEVLPQPKSETLPRILGGEAPENMAASESPPPPDNVLYEVGSLQRLSDIPIQSVPSDICRGPMTWLQRPTIVMRSQRREGAAGRRCGGRFDSRIALGCRGQCG